MNASKDQKTVQEATNATVRALASVDALGRFVEDAFGYPVREASGFLGDWIKFKRDNWRATCEMAKDALKVRGVDHIKPIPAKYGVSLIEKISLEDDELIQSMWAGLIVNSLDPSVNVQPKKVFISILGALEPVDAVVLKKLCRSSDDQFIVAAIVSCLGCENCDGLMSAQNLSRLGLIAGQGVYQVGMLQNNNSPFCFSPLAVSMMNSINTQ